MMEKKKVCREESYIGNGVVSGSYPSRTMVEGVQGNQGTTLH
jgi:hypothetical protein